jgi:predicted glycosyltransferase
MNILFDIGHPAHVHLFKNFIFYLQQKKITFTVLTRNKEITNQLLNHYNIPFHSISSPRSSKLGMLFELCVRNFKILKFYLKNDYTLSLGTSVSIGHLTKFSKGKVVSWNFNEDDDSVVPLYTKLAYPHSSIIINPNCLEFKHWQKKRVLHPSYHELAYLHPNNFRADENIIKKYGLKKNNYIVFRFSALTAHHDSKAKGISPELKDDIQNILNNYEIIESFESKSGSKIEPWDMHHVLANAKMIISDSQTMTIEGSVLGVPSIRINTFIGKSTVIEELENKYEIAYGFFPNDKENIISLLKKLINDDKLEEKFKIKKKLLLKEKIDFNKWLIDYFEDEIK